MLLSSAHPESDGLTEPGTADVILPDTESVGRPYFGPQPRPEVPEEQGDRHEVVEVEDDAHSIGGLLINGEFPHSERPNYLELSHHHMN